MAWEDGHECSPPVRHEISNERWRIEAGMGRGKASRQRLLLVSVVVAVVTAGVAAYFLGGRGPSGISPTTHVPGPGGPGGGPACRGSAACFSDNVTHIVDGDTLDIGQTRIRLTLVNSPDVGQSGYAEAKEFTNRTCPVGSVALVDEDDGQTGGSYGRMVALVYCHGVNLNAELLRTGNAVLLPSFCSVSEFARDPWTGCP
jgi:hypothetical protein